MRKLCFSREDLHLPGADLGGTTNPGKFKLQITALVFSIWNLAEKFILG